MTEVLILTIVVTVLIALNGLYVAAEFCIISLPKIKLEQLASQGNVNA